MDMQIFTDVARRQIVELVQHGWSIGQKGQILDSSEQPLTDGQVMRIIVEACHKDRAAVFLASSIDAVRVSPRMKRCVEEFKEQGMIEIRRDMEVR